MAQANRSCLGTASRAQLLKKSALLFHLIGDNTQPGCTCVKPTLLSSHLKRRAQLVFEQEPILVSRIFHPGRSYECSPVHTTGGSLTCRRYLLAPLTGNKENSKGITALLVKRTPTVIIPRWTTHPYILYQVCAARGARANVALYMEVSWRRGKLRSRKTFGLSPVGGDRAGRRIPRTVMPGLQPPSG